MPYTNLADIHKIEFVANVTCENNYCLFDLHNNIIFLANMTVTGYKANDTLFSLPEEMYPAETVCKVVPTAKSGDVVVQLTTSGEVKCTSNLDDVVYMGGVSFNISGKYYSEKIGNVDKSKFTTPLWGE